VADSPGAPRSFVSDVALLIASITSVDVIALRV